MTSTLAIRRQLPAADELISRVRFPRLGSGEVLKLFKVSKRRDLDISTFSAAVLAEAFRPVYSGCSHRLWRRGPDDCAPAEDRGSSEREHYFGRSIRSARRDGAFRDLLRSVMCVARRSIAICWRLIFCENCITNSMRTRSKRAPPKSPSPGLHNTSIGDVEQERSICHRLARTFRMIPLPDM